MCLPHPIDFDVLRFRYETTGAEKWRIAAETYIKQLDGQPRTAEGQYWHKLRYFNQGTHPWRKRYSNA